MDQSQLHIYFGESSVNFIYTGSGYILMEIAELIGIFELNSLKFEIKKGF
jgi:hypothetical protein